MKSKKASQQSDQEKLSEKDSAKNPAMTAKDLMHSEEYSRFLFNSSPIGLALCKMDGTLIDVNPAYASIIDRTVEETLKLTYWDITPVKYADKEKEELRSLEEKGSYGAYEKEYIHKDGHLVPVRLHSKILEIEGEKFIWSSIEDITEHKFAEEKIIEQLNELKRWQAVMIGRENRNIELKHEVNELLKQSGKPEKYKS